MHSYIALFYTKSYITKGSSPFIVRLLGQGEDLVFIVVTVHSARCMFYVNGSVTPQQEHSSSSKHSTWCHKNKEALGIRISHSNYCTITK